MKDYNENSPSEMLNLLLDNELDEAKESAVFSELAGDAALQQEFKELMSIRESVRNDIEAFTPPAEATRNVFGELGFAPPIGNGDSRRALPWYSKWKKLAIPAIGLIALSLIGISTINHFNRSETNNNKAAVQADVVSERKEAIPTDKNAVNEHDIPLVSSSETNSPDNNKAAGMNQANDHTSAEPSNAANNGGNNNNILSSNDNSIAASVSRNKIASNSFIPNHVAASNPIYTESEPFMAPGSSERILALNNAMNYTPASITVPGRAQISNSRSWKIYARNIYPLSSAEQDLQRTTNPLTENIGLAFMFGLNDNFNIGFEFSNEPIMNKGQDPTVMRLGLAFRYEIKQINLLGIYPYGQLGIGGSTLGSPDFRGNIGLQYSINNKLGLNFGYEYSYIFYKLDQPNTTISSSEWFETDKFGVTMGLFYAF
ncbi:MAG: hypothetical protein ACLFR2_09505 [Candidatus Kapaibacterium sp.]